MRASSQPHVFCSVIVITLATQLSAAYTFGNYSGDILLAAYFPVHGAASQTLSDNATEYCGEIQEQDGIQTLEAFYNALDAVKRNRSLLPGIRLGGIAMDSCDSEHYSLAQTMEMIQVLMMRGDFGEVPFVCRDGTPPEPNAKAQSFAQVVGVVGGSSSTVSLQLASLFRLFTIPQISYLSTSSDLGNVDRFPFFKRTVPSDIIQAAAIIELLQEFNWTYVSVIYENSNYGVQGYNEIERASQLMGVCFASVHRIDFDIPGWDEENYDNILDDVGNIAQAMAVILWMDSPRAREVFAAAERMRVRKVWVGSDAWSARTSVTDDYESAVRGSVTLQPLAADIKDFDSYFTSLKPSTNERNPWFQEYWEHYFDCSFESTLDSLKCTGNETLSSENGYEQQKYLHFVHDAVFAFAHALTTMQSDLCGDSWIGMCEEMEPDQIDGETLLAHLEDVNFIGASGLEFAFYRGQGNAVKADGPPRYTLMNFVYNREHDNYSWVEVGNYSDVNNEQHLDFERSFKTKMANYPPSVCSEPCLLGQYRQSIPGESCCWICTNCSDYSVVVTVGAEQFCRPCPAGKTHDENRTECIWIPETFVSFTSTLALACVTFALVGITSSAVIFVIFLKFWTTPVIKASGKELSLCLLGGITLSFISTFLFVNKPSAAVCGVTRVLLGLCFTVIYATILTKTNRIARIFSSGTTSPQKARYTSPKSQLLIVSAMVSVEVLVLIGWLAVDPPDALYVYPSPDQNVLVCAGSQNASYLIPLCYPFLVLLLCTYYAFKTRKTPDGFNETRLIAFTCYTTCVIWLAFISIYLSTNTFVRIAVICLSVSLNAFVALGCLFVPKAYVCLVTPEKNTREAVMTRTGSVISNFSNIQPPPSQDSLERKDKEVKDRNLCIMEARPRAVSLDPMGKDVQKKSSSMGVLNDGIEMRRHFEIPAHLAEENKMRSEPMFQLSDRELDNNNQTVALDSISTEIRNPSEYEI